MRDPHLKRPDLRVAAASVVGLFVSSVVPLAALAGGPLEGQSAASANAVGASPVSNSTILTDGPVKHSPADSDFPIRSTSPFYQDTPSPKPPAAGFRVHAVTRDNGKSDPVLRSAPAGFRVHAPPRAPGPGAVAPGADGAPSTDRENLPADGGTPLEKPSAGFRLHAIAREDAESPAQRKPDLASRTPASDSADPGDTGAISPSSLRSSNPNPGYYPTRREWDTIGGYYPRTQGDNPGGPESASNTQAPSGLWPYPSAKDPLFGAHPAFFDAIDRYVGLFAPSGGISVQGPNPSTGGLLSFNGGLPFVTRAFNPERATFKLGPIYIDLLGLNGTLLYSQYKGPETFAPGEGPGWLGLVSLDFRVVVPLAENLFIAASGEVYFLPKNGKFGFIAADANGLGAGLNIFAAYEKEIHGWWLTLTDHLGTEDRFGDLYDQARVDEIDVAGRYRFGSDKTASDNHVDFFSDKRLYLVNTVDATVVGLLNPIWRLTADINRSDAWNFDNFDLGDDYHGVTTASLMVDYYGQNWRFAPYLKYLVTTPDDFQTELHELEVGIRGPITERLRMDALVGYGFTTGLGSSNDTLIYQVGLIHELGPYTQQSIFGGNVLTFDEFGDRTSGRYLRYTLNQVLSRHLNANLYVQWEDSRDLDTGIRSEGPSGGAFINYDIGQFTHLVLGVGFESYRADGQPDYTRLVYTAQLDHRIRAGLTGTLLYRREQYQESDGGLNNFSENLYELQLTLAF